jgi:hypothetical protein
VQILLPAVIGAITGALSGAFLAYWVNYLLLRRLRAEAHWRALEAEAELCREMAEAFLNGATSAPLYRLPVLSYQHSFPVLLADGAPNREEVEAVTRFYSQVETLNRGLDQAHVARGNQHELDSEHARNILKADRLTVSGRYYKALRGVLDKHVK